MMNADLEPIEEQVVVVTGASSGIGLSTARMAADRGARVVLAARSEDALEELEAEIEDDGGEAVAVTADVRERNDVGEIAAVAVDEFGGFDTWVNCAGAFLYGRLRETPIEDMREQFETNVWGLLYGSLEAADHLEDDGGAIVNIGSVASDRAIPLQGSYSASKHAAKAFTDSLRMELADANAPVAVTLVKPAAIDTPYPEHAKNHMDDEPSLPPPIYEPETAARSILHAAETGERDVFVGSGAKGLAALEHYAPAVLDDVMERLFFELQQADEPADRTTPENLEEPTGTLDERGDYDGYVASSSLYTRLSQRLSPIDPGVAAIATVVLYTLYRLASRSDGEHD